MLLRSSELRTKNALSFSRNYNICEGGFYVSVCCNSVVCRVAGDV